MTDPRAGAEKSPKPLKFNSNPNNKMSTMLEPISKTILSSG